MALSSPLHSGNQCLACHHGVENNSPFLAMADCLVCHNKVDPPISCGFCHVEGSKLKPANHTADFLDSHSRASAKLDLKTCAVCHGRKFTRLGGHLGYPQRPRCSS